MSHTESPEHKPRDGVRWRVFGLAACAFWLSFFHRVAPAAIAGDLQSSFAVSGAMLGALAATYYVVYTVMQVPTGILNDGWGPRRVLTSGCVIAGGGSLLFAMAQSVIAAAAGRTLVGLGVSVAFVSLLKLNADWFHERRFATVSGLASTIALTGALAAATPLAWLVTLTSWRNVFGALGLASWLLAAAIWLLVPDRPDGDARRGAAAGVDGRDRVHWYRGLATVARNPATWPGFWVCFGMSGSYMTFVGLWAVPYLVDAHGRTPVEATQHTSLMILSLAASQAAVAVLSDRVGRRKPLMNAFGVLYVACWLAWLTGLGRLPGASWILSVLMGLGLGGFTLAWSCAKEVNPPRLAGTAVSVVNIGGFLAVGLLQPLFGWLLDYGARGAPPAGTHYTPGILLLTAAALLGLAGVVFVRETGCRNIWVDGTARGSG